VRVDRRPIDRLVACAARPGGVSAAVAKACDVADEDLAGAEGVSGQRAGGRTIHAPDVDRTNSPTAAIKTTVGVRLPPGSGSLGADALRREG
jgi:hypothetical protein